MQSVVYIYNYTISMQTVVYNSPLYCLLLFFRCILNVFIIKLLSYYYYFIIIFFPHERRGLHDPILVLINSISSYINILF